MKNILEILKSLNVELTDEQKKSVEKEVNENYKTINDYDNQKKKLELAEQKEKDAKQALDDLKKDLDGIDVKDLKQKVDDFDVKMKDQKKIYETKIRKMELDGILKEVSSSLGCVDYDLAKTQIDYDKLLESKNQKDDAKDLFESLKKSKPILFEQKKQTKKRDILPNGEDGGEGKQKPLSLKDALKSHYKHEDDE